MQRPGGPSTHLYGDQVRGRPALSIATVGQKQTISTRGKLVEIQTIAEIRLLERAEGFACDADTSTFDSENMMQLAARLKLAVEYMKREQIHEIPDYQDKCTPDCDECARRKALGEIEEPS